jgi:hypothetical protein
LSSLLLVALEATMRLIRALATGDAKEILVGVVPLMQKNEEG